MPGLNKVSSAVTGFTVTNCHGRFLKLWLQIILFYVFLSNNSTIATPFKDNQKNFTECIANLHIKARDRGISESTIAQVLSKARFIPRVIELDRHQPEFTQLFGEYFNKRVNEDRVRSGKTLLTKHRQLLAQIQQKTGVPAQFLLAFWGLETNYGSYLGRMPIPDSLATLACDYRRQAFFTGELLKALHIIDRGDIPADNMVGSWAGAMGHMQFMPSTYLQYARDGDGDGRRNLWGSIPDALVSAGYFLQQLGWNAGSTWGQEVQVPASFDYSLTGRQHSLSLAEWIAHGVKAASGSPLPSTDKQVSILVPAGHKGPAFLVYENFDVIMGWNRSEFYALTVGHLADRIAGARVLYRSPPTDGLKLSRKQVLQLQLDLSALGIDAGEADGIFGPDTRRAISRFQQKNQRIADGYPDLELINAIREAAQER